MNTYKHLCTDDDVNKSPVKFTVFTVILLDSPEFSDTAKNTQMMDKTQEDKQVECSEETDPLCSDEGIDTPKLEDPVNEGQVTKQVQSDNDSQENTESILSNDSGETLKHSAGKCRQSKDADETAYVRSALSMVTVTVMVYFRHG